MTIPSFMLEDRHEVLAEAVASVKRARLEHYEKAGTDLIRQRLDDLLSLTTRALAELNLPPLVAHANAVALKRFKGGVDPPRYRPHSTFWRNQFGCPSLNTCLQPNNPRPWA